MPSKSTTNNKSRGVSQIGFIIGTTFLIVFIGIIAFNPSTPLYIGGNQPNTLELDTHQTMMNITKNTLKKDDGHITAKEIRSFSSNDLEASIHNSSTVNTDIKIRFEYIDQTEGTLDKHKTNPLLNNSISSNGEIKNIKTGTPPLTAPEQSTIITVDERLVEVTVWTWRNPK